MLRKIGTIPPESGINPATTATVYFGDTEYEMCPLGVAHMSKIIAKVLAIVSEHKLDFSNLTGGQEYEAVQVLVDSGIVEEVVCNIFGVPQDEYNRTTVVQMINNLGEFLRLNFFQASEQSRKILGYFAKLLQ